MRFDNLRLSSLGHTWIFDIDGTIAKHNGYKIDGHDTLLPGVKDFFEKIPPNDMIVFITSRTDYYRDITINFLNENGLRYDHIIFNAPYGERVLVNDDKPSGLSCSISLNFKRDSFEISKFIIDNNL